MAAVGSADHRGRATVFRAFADETLDHDLHKELIALARRYEILANCSENVEHLPRTLRYTSDQRLPEWVVSRAG